MEEDISSRQLLCMLCCPPWPPRVAAKIAFRPPRPSYSFEADSDGNLFLSLHDRWFSTPPGKTVDCFFVTSSRGNRIACALFRCTEKAKFTILYSHGNAADIGEMHSSLSVLGEQLSCDFLCYDYSGYGLSSGRPSEKNLLADIDCVWNVLSSRMGVPPERTILYGHSLGTVPTVDLAARTKSAAVILHSPLLSALRVIRPSMKKSWWCDFFLNIDKVPRITSPVLVIHGVDDQMVPFYHGRCVYEMCESKVQPLWILGAGHDFLECRREYLARLKHLIDFELNGVQETQPTNSAAES